MRTLRYRMTPDPGLTELDTMESNQLEASPSLNRVPCARLLYTLLEKPTSWIEQNDSTTSYTLLATTYLLLPFTQSHRNA